MEKFEFLRSINFNLLRQKTWNSGQNGDCEVHSDCPHRAPQAVVQNGDCKVHSVCPHRAPQAVQNRDCKVHSDCPHQAPQALATCRCVARRMHRFTCTSQKVLPGQLTVDVARILPGLATPTCTTQPQRHPGPTSATTPGWSAGRDGDGDSKQLQDSDPAPQLSVCTDGPWNSPCVAVPAVT